jgi:hypothetical protein
MGKQTQMSQREMKQRIDVGPAIGQVSPVIYWYRHGHFSSEEQAQGAFELAYQQGMDGMGSTVAKWMGLTDAEFDAWMRSKALPKK